MMKNVKNLLIERVKSSHYSLHLDGITDLVDMDIRYECYVAVLEDFLFCQTLEARTRAEHLYKVLEARTTAATEHQRMDLVGKIVRSLYKWYQSCDRLPQLTSSKD